MKRLAAFSLLTLAVTGLLAASSPSQQQFKIQVDVDLVNVNFAATDSRGRPIAGLTAESFRVKEDGVLQRVTQFSRERELPLTIAMVVDVSPSVSLVLAEQKRTATAFLEAVLGPKDLGMVISFDREVTLMQDYTESLRMLARSIDELKVTSGGTSLYDAVFLASEKLASEAGRKAIVLLSDGEDSTSTFDMSKALIQAHAGDVVIYSISNAGNSGTMRRLSEDTGGAFFRVRSNKDFTEVFERIASELRTQYSLAYQSTNPARDGSFRRIEIAPKDSKVRVRARKGYYAPNAASAR